MAEIQIKNKQVVDGVVYSIEVGGEVYSWEHWRKLGMPQQLRPFLDGHHPLYHPIFRPFEEEEENFRRVFADEATCEALTDLWKWPKSQTEPSWAGNLVPFCKGGFLYYHLETIRSLPSPDSPIPGSYSARREEHDYLQRAARRLVGAMRRGRIEPIAINYHNQLLDHAAGWKKEEWDPISNAFLYHKGRQRDIHDLPVTLADLLEEWAQKQVLDDSDENMRPTRGDHWRKKAIEEMDDRFRKIWGKPCVKQIALIASALYGKTSESTVKSTIRERQKREEGKQKLAK